MWRPWAKLGVEGLFGESRSVPCLRGFNRKPKTPLPDGRFHAAYHASVSSSDSGRVPEPPWGHHPLFSENGRNGGAQVMESDLRSH